MASSSNETAVADPSKAQEPTITSTSEPSASDVNPSSTKAEEKRAEKEEEEVKVKENPGKGSDEEDESESEPEYSSEDDNFPKAKVGRPRGKVNQPVSGGGKPSRPVRPVK